MVDTTKEEKVQLPPIRCNRQIYNSAWDLVIRRKKSGRRASLTSVMLEGLEILIDREKAGVDAVQSGRKKK